MFRTSMRAEIPTSALYGDQFRLWAFVEHSLQTPWFYVTVASYESGQPFRTMLLIHQVHALEALLDRQDAGMKVAEIQLVSPSHINKNDRWLMEPLLELVHIDCQGAHSYEYRVESGRWYADQMEATSSDEQGLRRIIFQRMQ